MSKRRMTTVYMDDRLGISETRLSFGRHTGDRVTIALRSGIVERVLVDEQVDWQLKEELLATMPSRGRAQWLWRWLAERYDALNR